jgi:uncharacterized protein with HEPN domain
LKEKRYCEDIAKSIDRFGNSFEVFLRDTDFYNSVSMSIMQIGELACGLSDEFKGETRARMPWGLMKGMRNQFAHAYATIDNSDIGETATADIPNLLRFCADIIEKVAKEHGKGIRPKDFEAR